uniref:Uncharacterized protein n=1 Tax=Panagrolaimus sp. PS1159 TaxID=55785 RepID=A0AC35G5D9_9BILA
MKTATRMTIRQKRDLRYPNITLCPKNPDSINLTMIKEDIYMYIPDLNDTDATNLITFAIAGSGFDNMDTISRRWDALLILCYYAGDKIPCCDIFRFSYVMLRGRCLKLREFYQEDPALTGTLTIYMRGMPSQLIERGGAQLQTILYVSDEYLDVATFPRYYLYPQKWNQLRLARQIISMLPNSPYCSNSTEAIGRGTCLVNSWLKSRIVNPLNCTLFYFQHKFPNLPICRPEAIRHYNVVANYPNHRCTRPRRARLKLPIGIRLRRTPRRNVSGSSYNDNCRIHF